MAKRVPFSAKRKEAPEWVFPWRRLGEAAIPKWFALLAVGGAFAFLVTSVRIRVTPPTPWAARKASVIQISDNAEGRALTQRAREGGPFPSRFEPAEWPEVAAMQEAAFGSARWTPPPYVPKLRDLPEKGVQPVSPATMGEAVLPKRKPSTETAAAAVKTKLAPVLRPLSGIATPAMPAKLPPFPGEVTDKMTAEPWWRFLLRLDASGNVLDCASLTGGNEADPQPLEDWLRRIPFNPEPSKPARWIAVEVGFSNQAADGTDAR